jgi:hypothetical protein
MTFLSDGPKDARNARDARNSGASQSARAAAISGSGALVRPITREGLTEQLIGAYEWALTLGDADAAVDAVLGIAELKGLQIDSVDVQSEIAATLAELERT